MVMIHGCIERDCDHVENDDDDDNNNNDTIIALKGAVQNSYNLLTAPRTISNTYA